MPTSGTALVSQAISRNHIANQVGYFPQKGPIWGNRQEKSNETVNELKRVIATLSDGGAGTDAHSAGSRAPSGTPEARTSPRPAASWPLKAELVRFDDGVFVVMYALACWARLRRSFGSRTWSVEARPRWLMRREHCWVSGSVR